MSGSSVQNQKNAASYFHWQNTVFVSGLVAALEECTDCESSTPMTRRVLAFAWTYMLAWFIELIKVMNIGVAWW